MEGKYLQQFKKGSLEMILLCLIAQKETYGYELLTQLNEHGAGVLGYAREGTIYPILYRLQEQGLVQSRLAKAKANGGTKKYYSLTPKGKRLWGSWWRFGRTMPNALMDLLKAIRRRKCEAGVHTAGGAQASPAQKAENRCAAGLRGDLCLRL